MLKCELEKRQSELIEAMRFPLIVLVVFIHVLPNSVVPVQMNLSGMNLYHFFSETLSHVIGGIAVPCFFLFSGFFFFYKLEVWNLCFYRLQLKKRCMTLLLPYFLWNMFMIVAIYTKQYIFSLLSLEAKEDGIFDIYNQTWFELFWKGPVDFPLWYLRDLICMSLLTPFFYYFFRYLKMYGLLILTTLYLITSDNQIPGLSMTAFLFFGIGAYFSIYKKSLLEICIKGKYVCAIGSLLFLCITVCNIGNEWYIYSVRPFIIFGIVVAINFMNRMISSEFWKKSLCRMSATVFFIYAVHEIYIINWVKGFFSRTSLADTGGGLLLAYVLIPAITILVCLGLYSLLNKIFPKFLAFIVGGRVKGQLIEGDIK